MNDTPICESVFMLRDIANFFVSYFLRDKIPLPASDASLDVRVAVREESIYFAVEAWSAPGNGIWDKPYLSICHEDFSSVVEAPNSLSAKHRKAFEFLRQSTQPLIDGPWRVVREPFATPSEVS